MSDNMPQPGPPVFHTRAEEPLTLAGLAQHTAAADIVRREVLAAINAPADTDWQQALAMLSMLARDQTYSERWQAQLQDARIAGQAEVRTATGWRGDWPELLAELRRRFS